MKSTIIDILFYLIFAIAFVITLLFGIFGVPSEPEELDELIDVMGYRILHVVTENIEIAFPIYDMNIIRENESNHL